MKLHFDGGFVPWLLATLVGLRVNDTFRVTNSRSLCRINNIRKRAAILRRFGFEIEYDDETTDRLVNGSHSRFNRGKYD